MGASMSIPLKDCCGSGHGLVDVRDGEERKLDVDVAGETSMERLRLRPIMYDVNTIDVGQMDVSMCRRWLGRGGG